MAEARAGGTAGWMPVWVAGGAVLTAALAAAALRSAGLPPPIATGAVAAMAAVGLGMTIHHRRKAGPWTRVGRRTAFPWDTVRLNAEDRLRHLHCIGPSGSGKTTAVLAPLLAQDVTAGSGVTVLELKGGELCSTARHFAAAAGRTVLQWDPANPDSACWNPLAHPGPEAGERLLFALQRANGHASAASEYYAAVGGAVIRHSIQAFTAAGAPLDLARLRSFLLEAPARQVILRQVTDTDTLAYFHHVFDAWRPDERLRNVQALTSAIDTLLVHPFVRRSLCPPPDAPQIDLDRCLREGAILLVTLPLGGMLRQATALGAFLLATLQAATYARQEGGPLHYIYLDEFQQFAGPGFGDFLALARSHRVGVVLAHQNLAQLRQAGGGALEETVLANARTTVLLRCDGPDAHAFSAWLPPRGGRPWRPEDLTGLPFGSAVVRTAAGRNLPRADVVRMRYRHRP